MSELDKLITGYQLNEGNKTTNYTIDKDTVYENLMVLKVMFTSIQVGLHTTFPSWLGGPNIYYEDMANKIYQVEYVVDTA